MNKIDEKTLVPITSIIVLSGIVFSYSLVYFNVSANAKDIEGLNKEIDGLKAETAQYRKDAAESNIKVSLMQRDVAEIKQILKEGK